MSRLSTATSATTAPAALTLSEQDLNQAENQASTQLANSTAADNPANWPIATRVASDVASALRATTTKLTTQRTYLSNLSDSLTTGLGSLVDANMNEAAIKLAGFQVRQPLGAQALSISNSDTRLILKLFEL
jgi:flagellin-like hook-associated protein FlgL